jgi:hypothetical protein
MHTRKERTVRWSILLYTIYYTIYTILYYYITPITVAARYQAGTVFVSSNAGIAGSNPTRGMDVCVRLFCVCFVLCVGRGLATG